MGDNTMKVEVSNGEIVDKLTILWIKEEKIADEEKLLNVRNEISELSSCLAKMDLTETSDDVIRLHEVNLSLWDIEDRIREKENEKDFGEDFISLARSVYVINDSRAKIKKQINITTGSDLVEEKSYEEYSQ